MEVDQCEKKNAEAHRLGVLSIKSKYPWIKELEEDRRREKRRRAALRGWNTRRMKQKQRELESKAANDAQAAVLDILLTNGRLPLKDICQKIIDSGRLSRNVNESLVARIYQAIEMLRKRKQIDRDEQTRHFFLMDQ